MAGAGPVRVRRRSLALRGSARLVAGERVGYLGEPAEFAGQVVVWGGCVPVDRGPGRWHVLSPPVQGSADVGRFNGGRAPPAGEASGVGPVTVVSGVGGIAVRLQREESVADGDHPLVEPFRDLARQRWARRTVRCGERDVGQSLVQDLPQRSQPPQSAPVPEATNEVFQRRPEGRQGGARNDEALSG